MGLDSDVERLTLLSLPQRVKVVVPEKFQHRHARRRVRQQEVTFMRWPSMGQLVSQHAKPS
jgi:hypothetical protein